MIQMTMEQIGKVWHWKAHKLGQVQRGNAIGRQKVDMVDQLNAKKVIHRRNGKRHENQPEPKRLLQNELWVR